VAAEKADKPVGSGKIALAQFFDLHGGQSAGRAAVESKSQEVGEGYDKDK